MDDTIPNEIFDELEAGSAGNRPEPELLDEGYYKLKVITDAVRIRVSKATGNRYLHIPVVAVATESGESVNSKVMNKIVMFEGLNKKGEANAKSFAAFFSKGLGYDRDDTQALYASLIASAPSPEAIADTEYGSIDINLTFGEHGEPLSLKGATLMGSVKQDTYNEKTRNTVASVWAVSND